MDTNDVNHPGLSQDDGREEKKLSKKAMRAAKAQAEVKAPEVVADKSKADEPVLTKPPVKEKVKDPDPVVPKEVPNIWVRAEAFDCGKEEAYMANVRRGTLLKVGSTMTFIPGATPHYRPELPTWGHIPGLGHILLPV